MGGVHGKEDKEGSADQEEGEKVEMCMKLVVGMDDNVVGAMGKSERNLGVRVAES